MIDVRQARGFDFHCHVDLYKDPQQIITSCDREKIVTLAVTTTPKAWQQNKIWASASAFVHVAVGLHPELAGERAGELPLLERYIREAPFVGEVGLDRSPQYKDSWRVQEEIFGRVLQVSDELGGRVLSIHSRRAAHQVIGMIRDNVRPRRALCILHWFSGTIGAAAKAAELGCYFSVNDRMLNTEAGKALTRSLPLDRLLTETDGPFIKNSAPRRVVHTTEMLARLRSVNGAEMIEHIAQNASRVFEFAGAGGQLSG